MQGTQEYIETSKSLVKEIYRNQVQIKKLDNGHEIHVPVIFHILLNEGRLLDFTEEMDLMKIIELQMDYINRDFNGHNADSVLIPVEFRHLFGNAKIRFALAHTSPIGEHSDGYEIYNTNIDGYTDNNSVGSGVAFSDAKYQFSGGADAWDPTTYLNIWVINSLTNTAGVAISPFFANKFQLPSQEIGIVLDYNYLSNRYNGRTLVHELGHYFGLKHLWGDNTNCPISEFDDDGISDTPPQEGPNYGCPTFPKFDKCTNGANGIMFMNYMDYTNESCKVMFTVGQIDVMRSKLMPFEELYSLTQNPAVLDSPKSKNDIEYTVYPNPASDKVLIVFKVNSINLKRLALYDLYGKIVKEKRIYSQRGFYFFDLTDLAKSIYLLHIEFPEKSFKERIVIY